MPSFLKGLQSAHHSSSARGLQGELQTTKKTKIESDLALAQENLYSLETPHKGLIEENELNAQRLADKKPAMIQLEARLVTQAALFKDLMGHLVYVEKQAINTWTQRSV
ncbi:MAG: hypothetical protein JAY71_17715 [Candidatus Thiodiazotropha weberae]|nr:hypothetical protein [Candidatus Thiodiazotropha weberae]